MATGTSHYPYSKVLKTSNPKIMKKFLALLVCLYVGMHGPLIAQTELSGLVIDQQTKEALPGVNILITGTQQGTSTDLDGKFQLKLDEAIKSLTISYVGYKTQVIEPKGGTITVSLEPSVVELSQLIVSASREAQVRSNTPVSISTVSAGLLDDTKATTLDQVLNKVSGVYMVDLGNEQHSMSVRQPLSYKSLFLYLEDGLPIRPTGVFNHNALLEMNMAALKKIEVVRGPSSSLYGSEAIGGAMNFITQRASAIPTARLSIQGDNQGYKRTDFRVSSTLKNGLGIAIGGYYAQRKDGYRAHSDMNKLALTAAIDYRLSPKTNLQTTTSFIDFQTDMTGSLDADSFFGQEYSSLQTFTERTVKAFRTQLKLTHRWTNNSNTAVRVFFRDNAIGQIPSYRIKDDYSPWSNPTGDSNLAHGERNENSFKSLGALLQHNQQFSDKLQVRVGASLDYSPSSYWANYIRIDKSDDGIYTGFEEDSDSVLTQYDVGLTNVATYAQLEYSPFDALRIVAALRYDKFNYNYDNFLPETAFSGAPDEKNSFDALTPKIGLTYDFGKDLGAYANYSVGFVPPQVGELYRGVKVPTLQPANYKNYEVGGWFAFPNQKGFVDLSLYRMDGTNEIISVQLDDGSRENRNAGATKHQGIEYTVKYEVVNGLSFRFSGTNANHEFVDYVEKGNDFSGKKMNRAPKFISNSELTFRPQFVKGLRLAVEWQHMSKYFMDEANTEEYGGFDIFNIRLGYQWKQVEAWVNLMNVTDRNYAVNASKSAWGTNYSPGLPRTIQLGIGYNFAKQQ